MNIRRNSRQTSHSRTGLVHDLGRHLGTQLNGVTSGEAFTRDSQALEMRDNTIAAGGLGSHFGFTLRLEEPQQG